MKTRSVVRFENFLLICGATVGATLSALVYSWVVLPLSSVHDACEDSKKSGNVLESFSDAYYKNVTDLSQTPFVAYKMAKRRAAKRLQEFDANKKYSGLENIKSVVYTEIRQCRNSSAGRASHS